MFLFFDIFRFHVLFSLDVNWPLGYTKIPKLPTLRIYWITRLQRCIKLYYLPEVKVIFEQCTSGILLHLWFILLVL